MSLVLLNTLTRKKEKFIPISPPIVQMYCCGPTVYDFLHIGNFRGAVFYNFLRLWLEHLGFEVQYYYNFTDVDDKIIKRAVEENSNSEAVSKKYIKEFIKDFDQLKLKPHEGNPKATEYIPQMIELIQNLIEQGKAYEQDGNVFYRVRNFKKYGQLSQRKLDDLYAGLRVEASESKENEEDFSLWKKSKENEPYWVSPWGKGRPGWHIECTTMIHHCLGDQIDIHGGGMDLIFPHHENEIAQSEGVKKSPFVKYWVHHNMFEFEGGKISKSLGTTQIMRSFLEKYNGEIFKYLVFNSHYRSVSEISQNTILQACSSLSRIYQALLIAKNMVEHSSVRNNQQEWVSDSKSYNLEFLEKIRHTRKEIEEALNDDLNTAKALASCFLFVRFFNDYISRKNFSSLQYQKEIHLMLNLFEEYGSIFSLFQEDPKDFLDQLDDILLKKSLLNRNQIDQLVEERAQAREKKDFAQADSIRKKLNENGVEIHDSTSGTSWRMDPSFFIK